METDIMFVNVDLSTVNKPYPDKGFKSSMTLRSCFTRFLVSLLSTGRSSTARFKIINLVLTPSTGKRNSSRIMMNEIENRRYPEAHK